MKELGEYLKSERLKQGLTLEALFERTRISIRVLEALEEGEFEKVGTPILLRGFLKAYCREVGIDSEPILVEYDRKICDYDCSPDSIRRFESWTKPARRRSPMGIYFIFLLVVGLFGALFASDWVSKRKALLSSAPESMRTDAYPQQELLSDFPQSGTPSQQPEVKEEALVENQGIPVGKEEVATQPVPQSPPVMPAGKTPVFDKKATEQTPVPKSDTVAKRSQESPALSESFEEGDILPEEEGESQTKPAPSEDVQVANVPSSGEPQERTLSEALAKEKDVPPSPELGKQILSIEAAQETWVQVTVDGKRVQGVLLKPGESRQWEASKKVELIVGNAGGVNLQWNGKPLKALGKQGQVVRLNLPDPKYLN